MKENSIKNERSSIKEDIERLKLCSTNQCNICGRYEKEECMLERNRCEQHILSDYKRLAEINLKDNDYIPTQKVKDKIEYLDNQQKQWLEDRELKASDNEIIFARDILQKLLESEE